LNLTLSAPPDLSTLQTWSTDQRWEYVAASLYFLLELDWPSSSAPAVFEGLKSASQTNLSHPEPRVRSLAARGCGACAAVEGRGEAVVRPLLEKVFGCIVRLHAIERGQVGSLKGGGVGKGEGDKSAAQEKAVALDDTAGWRELETCFSALAAVVRAREDMAWWNMVGCGADEALRVLLYCGTKHVNRHVRAEAIDVCCATCESFTEGLPPNFDEACKGVLEGTLRDNWSQVRMAGCKLCRCYVRKVGVPDLLVKYMSLNRFYLADGVRLYSQETWKLHVPDGKERLERNISSVAAWYLKCLDEDNHVVRESAALAIGELVSKLSEESVRPSLPLIQESVKAAFYDESWPVRDRALVCLSVIAGRFGCDDEDVWGLMWGNLGDQIWSVRDNAGWGIGEWLKGMPAGAERDKKLEETKAKFEELAQKAKEEPKRSRKDVQNEVNDKAAHTNNQLYSCGSLAPKLHKSANRVTGCSDCMVLRPTRQWERTDGAAYLLGHLASSSLLPDAEIVEMLKALVDATRHEIYVEHETLKATVMKVFSKIVEAKESKVFKRHYCNLILSCITRWISTGGSGDGIGNLMVFEGENCLEKVAAKIGEGIARGRMEELEGDRGLELLDRVSAARGGMRGGPMGGPMGGSMGGFPRGPGAAAFPRPPMPAVGGERRPPGPPMPSVKGLSLGGEGEAL